jgi:hypothetical protein
MTNNPARGIDPPSTRRRIALRPHEVPRREFIRALRGVSPQRLFEAHRFVAVGGAYSLWEALLILAEPENRNLFGDNLALVIAEIDDSLGRRSAFRIAPTLRSAVVFRRPGFNLPFRILQRRSHRTGTPRRRSAARSAPTSDDSGPSSESDPPQSGDSLKAAIRGEGRRAPGRAA